MSIWNRFPYQRLFTDLSSTLTPRRPLDLGRRGAHALRRAYPGRDPHCRRGGELRGRSIRRGARLFLNLSAANRDPDQFADPEQLDVRRQDNRHLALGHGIHFCVGAPLARLEASIVLPKLFARFSNVEPGAEAPVYRPDFIARGFSSFPVRLN